MATFNECIPHLKHKAIAKHDDMHFKAIWFFVNLGRFFTANLWEDCCSKTYLAPTFDLSFFERNDWKISFDDGKTWLEPRIPRDLF